MKKTTTMISSNISAAINQKKWHTSITLKIALLAWGLIISSIVVLGVFNFLNQQKIILERMKIEASNVTESIIQAHATSLFTDNYEAVIDFCTKLISSSSSIEFIALTKNDGNSLKFTRTGWSFVNLQGSWVKPDEFCDGKINYSDFLQKETYRFSKPFIFTGINWGYVHLGISLDTYHEAMRSLIWRTAIFSLTFIILGFFIAVLFSRRLTKPIKELVKTTREIEGGNLSARAKIFSNDELGFLAHSFNSMTIAVSKSNDFLEATVEERTLELGQTNKKLVGEVNERIKAEVVLHQYAAKLETLEEIYKGIINAETTDEVFYNTIEYIHKLIIKFTMASLCLYDEEQSLINVYSFSRKNDEFIKINSEYASENFSGLNKQADAEYFLQNELATVENKSLLEKLIFDEGRKSYISFPLVYQNELIGELNFGFDDKLVIDDDRLNTLIEISHHVSVAVMQIYLEEKLRDHAEEMKQSLEEKETLLKEIHHRVKNNLQVISSLLFLQSRNIKDEASLAIFRDSQMRVRSLALVHEKLYQSNNLSKIDFAEYIKNLVAHIKGSYKISNEQIAIFFELDKIYLPVDKAVPLGLLLNELLSNAFKYAFPENNPTNMTEKFIQIKFTTTAEDKLILMVSDNGVGISDTYDFETSTSLGLKIVTSLVTQIDGKLRIKNKDNTEFEVEFGRE